MRHHRRHHHHNHRDDSSLAGFLLKFGLLTALVIFVGGATWIALTPLDAVQKDVIIPISNDRFKG